MSTRLLDAHVARCAGCREFAGGIHGRAAPARLGAPDLSRRVARLAAIADRAGSWSIVRGLLAAVALEILVFSLPELVLGDDQDASEHSARHLGAFTVAYAVGLLVVVVRPARARAMLPVAVVLAGALLVTAVVDLVNGRVPLVDEAQHLPEVVSVVLVWLLAVPPARRGGRTGSADDGKTRLRVVGPHRRAG